MVTQHNKYAPVFDWIINLKTIGEGYKQFTVDFQEWVCDGCEGSDLGYQVSIILDVIGEGKDRLFFEAVDALIRLHMYGRTL